METLGSPLLRRSRGGSGGVLDYKGSRQTIGRVGRQGRQSVPGQVTFRVDLDHGSVEGKDVVVQAVPGVVRVLAVGQRGLFVLGIDLGLGSGGGERVRLGRLVRFGCGNLLVAIAGVLFGRRGLDG